MRIIAFLVAMAISTPGFAETATPLPPGKPAGLRQAQMTEGEWGLIALGAAAAIGGIVALASSNNHPAAVVSSGTTTTTSTTTTTTTTTTGTSP